MFAGMEEQLIPMTHEEIATEIAVLIAATLVKLPELAGKAAPVDPIISDRLRAVFASELVAALKQRNVRFLRVRKNNNTPISPGLRSRAC